MFLHRKSSLENKTTICDNPILVSRCYTFCIGLQCIMYCLFMYWSGADPGFKVKGAHLKKLGVFRVKKRFYANKSYSYQLRREARNILGYFVWKITILRQQIIFFTILGGGAPGAPPPLDPPLLIMSVLCMLCVVFLCTDYVCFMYAMCWNENVNDPVLKPIWWTLSYIFFIACLMYLFYL